MKSEFYEKIINERDSSKKNDPTGVELELLSHLWHLAFINDDQLPESFNLNRVHMSKYAIENIFARLGINADVKLTTCSNGASFKVILN